jgi:hypothetical protein
MAKNNYVNNADLYQAIIKRKKDLKEAKALKKPKPAISNYIGQCLLLIAQNLAHLPRFAKYTFREELIGDGIENCILYFDNFNLKYKNPHAYFTQITYYAFVRRIQKEKKQLYAKYKFHEQLGVLSQSDGISETAVNNQFQVYENISDFIKTYEEKAQEKKDKLADAKKKVKPKAKKKAVKKKSSKNSTKRIHR